LACSSLITCGFDFGLKKKKKKKRKKKVGGVAFFFFANGESSEDFSLGG
jgi:hypothetical protein